VTSRILHRPARTVLPVSREAPLTVTPPPLLPEGKTATGMHTILPMGGAVASMSMMMFFRGSGFAALGALIMVMSVAAAGLFYLSQRGQATRRRRQQRERYMTYLEELREEMRAWEQQTQHRHWQVEPPCSHLLDLVRNPARLWERRRIDPDFLRIRLGTGQVEARELVLRKEGSPVNPADPFMVAEANALVRRFRKVPGLPLRVNLDRAGHVSVVADTYDSALNIARALIIQIAATHAPDDVPIALIANLTKEAQWMWARWLPHLLDRDHSTTAGPQPLMAMDAESLVAILKDDLTERSKQAAQSYRYGSGAQEAATRRRLVIIDDAYGDTARELLLLDQATDLESLGITVVHLVADRIQEPSEITARVTVFGESLTVEHLSPTGSMSSEGTPDVVPLSWAEGLARELAPLRLSPDSYDDGSGTPPANFNVLLGIDDPTRLDLSVLWKRRSERDFLRIPIGVSDGGPTQLVMLDLKESAQLGMGPHGLCIGATGSGKSELLRGLVLALAVTHPPEQVSMMLVDYKGGATFALLSDLPHIAGLLTNLAADASLVERMYTSLDGEVLRRQQVLADAGKLTDIVEYNMRRDDLGAPTKMPPLQHLIVIIDEFGELLAAKPDFIELFLRIGRIGRSIGVHLLLSSQRLEEGKLRGLDTYLSYRIGLRTLSEMESRTVLDNPDAFHLPPLPGLGYLKVDVTIYERFKSAYVSGPLARDEEELSAGAGGIQALPLPRYGLPSAALAPSGEPVRATARTTGPTLMSTIAAQLAAVTSERQVQPIWLPPLPSLITLDQATGGFDILPEGVRLRATRDGGLHVPIGVLDDPARQWQGPWLLNLADAGGNLAILGGPSSGKSFTLRTIALGLATSYTPTEVGIYGADLLGNGLRSLEKLPHVGGIAGRDHRERLRRTFDELQAMLDQRERLFRHFGIDSVEELRAARASGHLQELPCTEIVLLLDGYGQLNGEFESLEKPVHDLLARGNRYAVHVIAAVRRWNEVRVAQQVSFGNRIELRLTDPSDSSIDPKIARTISHANPGRALTNDKLLAQVALPRLDSLPDTATTGTIEAANMVRSAWTGPLPPPIRVLPAVLRSDELTDASLPAGIVPIGRFEQGFTPALLDLFGTDQHLLVLGDTDTGKTNLLALIAQGLYRQLTPDDLVFAVFDPRHGLAGAVPELYLGGYASNPTLANQLAQAVAKELANRSGGPGDKANGPRIVLLIDDYDVLSTSATQPLSPFVPYLASGRDIGLHVLMTRRVMGASRGLYEPFTTSVRESGCLSLLMSGDRSEGQLFPGIRPTTLPVGRSQLIRPGEPARIVQTAYFTGEKT
jgi:DNA segregation ATPase FtsK/SpoIIIE, S-DNA-T family